MKRIGSILLWSAIAAAFIGPGTVTAAASAGASAGTALLWAILFSGVATFTLQEFAGRMAVTTGEDLASVLRTRYPIGFARIASVLLVGGAILLGCAAYEAGNILGAAGAMLALDLPREAVTV
ncbi:MAG: divalent metal cation transporter, partial [Pseudomonadota bacterium]|nr:divalent metal cation transporter [Pseudomonadota bacterium]